MAKAKQDAGLEIPENIGDTRRGGNRRKSRLPPVSVIRERTGLSQSRFAQLLGVSVRTLQSWEQERRAPAGAARTLLLIAHRNPRILLDLL